MVVQGFPRIVISHETKSGWLDIELSTECIGGHSSMPPDETCIGILAKAVSHLEQRQLPAFFDADEVTYQVLTTLAPYSQHFLHRFVLANLWLFRVSISCSHGHRLPFELHHCWL